MLYRKTVLLACLLLTLSFTASRAAAQGTTIRVGYESRPFATGLNLPTHLTYGPDGALYATELNGGEEERVGRVVRIVKEGTTPEPLLDGLYKPTGLAFAGDLLYIVARNTILVSNFKDGKLSPPQPVFTDALIFNGRSNGQIFLGPDGNLYFQSTGNEGDVRTSGVIYFMKPGTNTRQVYAHGLKNAYSMAWNPTTKQMVTTEIGDGDVPGVGQPPEELNIVYRGSNFGWPQCYANQLENSAWGGNRNICADTDVPLALFDPQNTPTGVAYFDGQWIVSLFWGKPPRLVSVDTAGKVVDFSTLSARAIALLADKEGGLLVVDFDGGKIDRITKKAS